MGILILARRINLRFMFIYVAHPQTRAQYGELYAVYNAIKFLVGVCGKASWSEGDKLAKQGWI